MRLCAFLSLILAATGLLLAADTRLADAVERGNLNLIRTLIAQKADLNAPQADGLPSNFGRPCLQRFGLDRG